MYFLHAVSLSVLANRTPSFNFTMLHCPSYLNKIAYDAKCNEITILSYSCINIFIVKSVLKFF